MCYPFDASCPSCDTYGYCRRQLTYPEAVQNVSAHYAQKGLKVSIVRRFGRFAEVEDQICTSDMPYHVSNGRRECHASLSLDAIFEYRQKMLLCQSCECMDQD
jgi:hypothetical protein